MMTDDRTEQHHAAKGKMGAALIVFQKAQIDHNSGLITHEQFRVAKQNLIAAQIEFDKAFLTLADLIRLPSNKASP